MYGHTIILEKIVNNKKLENHQTQSNVSNTLMLHVLLNINYVIKNITQQV